MELIKIYGAIRATGEVFEGVGALPADCFDLETREMVRGLIMKTCKFDAAWFEDEIGNPQYDLPARTSLLENN